MNTPEALSFVVSALALAIPTTFAVAAFASPPRLLSRHASLAGGLALLLSLVFTLAATLGGAWAAGTVRTFGVRVDTVTCVMLMLVCGIGLVIARYSERSLLGDPGLARYSRWLLLTLGTKLTHDRTLRMFDRSRAAPL